MPLAALILPLVLMPQGSLKIVDTKIGSGMAVKTGDQVTVDYTGKLTNGKQFDSSIGRAPLSFVCGAGNVIQGWDRGLVGMKVGGSRTLTIPSEMGYGAKGAPPDIPANATLVFTIDLKKVDRIQIQTLTPGKGEPLKGPAIASVVYKAMLSSGKVLESNTAKNPMEVHLGPPGLIPGFEMGLVGMKVGEKRKVTIPQQLGEGARSVGPIPANSTLIFEISLLKVTKR